MLSHDCHIHVMILEGEILTFYKVPIDLFAFFLFVATGS